MMIKATNISMISIIMMIIATNVIMIIIILMIIHQVGTAAVQLVKRAGGKSIVRISKHHHHHHHHHQHHHFHHHTRQKINQN